MLLELNAELLELADEASNVKAEASVVELERVADVGSHSCRLC